MQKKYLSSILITSLAFNIAFIGVFIYHLTTRPPLPPSPYCIKKPPIREFISRKKNEMKAFNDEFRSSRKRFLESLAAADFDETISLKLLEENVGKHMAMEKEAGISLIEFRKKIDAEEAADFFGRMNKFQMPTDQQRFGKENIEKQNWRKK
jgi:hypothetical protein